MPKPPAKKPVESPLRALREMEAASRDRVAALVEQAVQAVLKAVKEPRRP